MLNRSKVIVVEDNYLCRMGGQLIWIVDLANRTVAIYRSSSSFRVVGEDDMMNGEDVLPGFECKVQDFFVDLLLE